MSTRTKNDPVNSRPDSDHGSVWRSAPAGLALAGDEVHVWRAALDVSPSQLHVLEGTLGDKERARSQRLRKDRDRFIAAHGALRAILARYLRADPGRLTFAGRSPSGKPALSGEFAEALRFNLSHSEGLGVYALSKSREVGIDVERVRQDLDVGAIGRQFFSSRELEAISALPQSERLHAFFNCWTRKEAYLKATGKGFAVPPDQFDVSVGPGQPAQLIRTEFDAKESSRWSLVSLDPGPGYVGALAVEGHGWSLRRWQWQA